MNNKKNDFLTSIPAEQIFEINKKSRLLVLIVLVLIVWTLVHYPLHALGLTVFLGVYLSVLWRYPYAWLVIVPALLPVMDFAPWTGRFFFDEFDLVILITLLVQYCRKPKQRLNSLYSLTTLVVIGLFSFLYIISLLRGLLPLQQIDANSFASYYSNFNSLRVGKGLLWALLLLPLLQQSIYFYNKAQLYLGFGVLIGLAGVIAASCWERYLFPGLFNFSDDYRIIALFSSMHTGGGHIDAYLMLTLPFIATLFLYSSRLWISAVIGIGLFVSGLYVLLVTFSRGPYLGIVVSFIILLISFLWCFKGSLVTKWYKFMLLPLLLFIVFIVAMPVFEGAYIQARFAQIDRDVDIRMAHWKDAISMMDEDLITHLFGMGLGSYPRTYLWRNSENVVPAMYQIDNENGNQFLKLSSGDSLYLGQYIAVNPHTTYNLSVDLRSKKDSVTLTMPICEKSLLYSFRCNWITVIEKTVPGQWRHIERVVESGEVGDPTGKTVGSLSTRPIQFSLYNGTAKTIVDVDNIVLTDEAGKNLISNGDFSLSTDHWFFSTDNHLPWHIKNLPVHILFDQGWLGEGAFFLLFLMAIVNCCKSISKMQNAFMAILLSSLGGFMVVGLVDSPFDAPRLTLLFFLLLFFALVRSPHVLVRSTIS